MSTHADPRAEVQERRLALAFAPVHKRAFGIATGSAVALIVFLATAVLLLYPPDARPGFLSLLAEYFYGYTLSWQGAFVGGAWGLLVGFVGGWFTAFCRNLALACTIWYLRTRAELHATRDFLDHI
ncbi:hypothetical protein BH23GEM3_BH23GEM3_10070 [soil metagenome]